jgi:hypothetical protein
MTRGTAPADPGGRVARLEAELAALRRDVDALRAAPARPPLDDMLLLDDVAGELRLTKARLAAMARRGAFPDLLEATRKHLLVRRKDYEEWKAGRWTSERAARIELIRSLASEGRPAKVLNRRRAGRRQEAT